MLFLGILQLSGRSNRKFLCDILFVFNGFTALTICSYTGCSGPGFALHSEIVVPYILNYGTEEQKERFLPKMVRVFVEMCIHSSIGIRKEER